MNPANYQKYCEICIHKTFESQRGIVCLKNNRKPNFDDHCPSFEETEANVLKRE
jgi:hypothetical protein